LRGGCCIQNSCASYSFLHITRILLYQHCTAILLSN
jgi:hypothetical protein